MSWPGGKGADGVYQRLISQIPPHQVYIEGCLGGGAILKHKKPARVSLAFDLDGAALDSFDSGGLTTQGVSVNRSKHRWGDPMAYLELWKYSPEPVVELIEADVLVALQHGRKNLDHHCFIYLDPPYLRSTRKSSAPLYRFEWTEEQHQTMLQLVKTLPARVMISGYWSELYAQALSDWRMVSFTAQTRQGPATEYVWMNYPEPKELHDYRYLGRDWIDRQRIRRKAQRWVQKLKSLPTQERYAILDALNSYLGQTGLASAAGLDIPDYGRDPSQDQLGKPV